MIGNYRLQITRRHFATLHHFAEKGLQASGCYLHTRPPAQQPGRRTISRDKICLSGSLRNDALRTVGRYVRIASDSIVMKHELDKHVIELERGHLRRYDMEIGIAYQHACLVMGSQRCALYLHARALGGLLTSSPEAEKWGA
ncbi:hypothetical protein AG1IA_03079 [Rhizoctonia solani AG-1 IA]|uniref:Uncharacterized protein n=1 Tax=Thanatephorus cucumeris (strain AG1-IA) TaxID=983506 RepID=L8X2P9_THACA|nr:hypothetical protein AG1IA_03079 [Rhizoctonia solani AG-1 IA]